MISTPVGIANDIIIDGETGYHITGKIEEIKDKIETLKDPNIRLKMGRKIQTEIKNRFDWGKIMGQYMDLYYSL